MKHRILLLAFLFAFAFRSRAQMPAPAADNMEYGRIMEQQNYNYYNNSYNSQTQEGRSKTPPAVANLGPDIWVTFDVNVMWNELPEAYVAIFNVRQVGQSAEQVNELLNTRIRGFMNGLRMMGVDSNSIFIDMISLVPNYSWDVEKKIFSKTYNEVPAGFEMQKNVHVKFRDPEMIDRMLTEATKYEIYDLAKIELVIRNQNQIFDSLRGIAIAEMKRKTEDYARLGFDLSSMEKNLAEESVVTFPGSRYISYKAFSQPSMRAATGSGIGKTAVNEAPKSATIIYNQLPYDYYDFVVNPAVVEPAVQFSFNLKLKYFKTPKQDVKSIFVLMPDGNLKELKMP